MKASLKRIIWGIGWSISWTLNDFVVYYSKGNPLEISYILLMFSIWVIPLIWFKDDKK